MNTNIRDHVPCGYNVPSGGETPRHGTNNPEPPRPPAAFSARLPPDPADPQQTRMAAGLRLVEHTIGVELRTLLAKDSTDAIKAATEAATAAFAIVFPLANRSEYAYSRGAVVSYRTVGLAGYAARAFAAALASYAIGEGDPLELDALAAHNAFATGVTDIFASAERIAIGAAIIAGARAAVATPGAEIKTAILAARAQRAAIGNAGAKP